MQSVLLIDDDRFILKLVYDILVKEGYRVVAVDSPEKALSMDLSGISIILCDFNMPGMNGVEVLEAMREVRNCHAPFIFLTGHSDIDVLIPVAIRHHAELLPKPVNPPDLLQMVRSQLGAGH